MTVPKAVLAIVLVGQTALGWAQSSASVQSVEVTGSRLHNGVDDGSAPVQVITAEEIQRRGVATLHELLGQLASGGAGFSDLGGNGSFASGSSSASLRNLGPQATLVLLNFRRVAPYPLANYSEVFANIDALPFEAIERIEILKSGASALYGSEAVAGVINVITRRDWVGLQARASHEQSLTSGRFGNSTASITAGFGSPDADSGNVLANLELYHRDGLMWRDVLQYANPAVTSRSPNFGSPSSYSWPGNVIGAGPLSGCAPEMVQGGLCRYDRYARFQVVPEADRANLLVTGRLPLQNGRQLFSELLLADTRTTYLSPFQPYGKALQPITWGDPANNTTQTFWYRGLPAGHPLNANGADDAELRYRFADGPNQEEPHTFQYRALAGLNGDMRGFDWETAVGVMGGRTQLAQRGWFSLTGFREVIGNDDPTQPDPLFFNRGYRIGQGNSPEVLAKLFPTYGYTGHVQQWFVDGKLTGPITTLPHGPLNMAVGGELRQERFTITPSAALLAGDIVGNGLSQSDASRLVASSFVELAGKASETTEVQAAARVDKFGNLAPHLSPKLGLRIQPSPQWLLRATAEGGFRAPNLTESAASTKYSYDSLNDPQRCPQATSLAADLRQAAALLSANDPQRVLLNARADNLTVAECQGALASIVRNNPDLKPESSRSLSAGVVLAPNKQWRLSLDAWDILRRNEIGLKSNAELLAAEAEQPAGTVNRLPLANDPSFSAAEQQQYGVSAGALRSVVGRFSNVSRTQNRGVDLAGTATIPSLLGPVELRADATYLALLRNWSATRNGWGDNLAGRGGNSRWRLSAGATLRAGVWAHSLQATSTTSTPLHGDFFDTTYTTEGCAAQGYSVRDCTIAGHTRWDYALRFGPWQQFSFGLNIQNVLGTRTPVGVAGWLNGGGILPPTADDPRGRVMRLSVEWREQH